jgi:hypothetical protein
MARPLAWPLRRSHVLPCFATPVLAYDPRNHSCAHASERTHLCTVQVGSIQDSEAIIAVVDVADRPRQALAMFQPGA